ncbi:MAG: hypothetical protein RMK29_09790 [Myxococcales bacterium]|nr:hypothetical protein [Myxococcota bacterium]MDW8281993.1 hypothetical protein [Myxococcales bacterium]
MNLLPGIAALLLGVCPAALRGVVTAAAGPEYDSNANRAEEGGEIQAQPSPLLRLQAGGSLWHAAGRHRLRLEAIAGGKVFLLPAAQDQNVAVIQLGYEQGVQLGPLRLGGVLDYYDAFQQAAGGSLSARDFRAGSTGLRLSGATSLPRGHRLDGAVDVVGQLFMYKPDGAYSFFSPTLQGRIGSQLHAGDPDLGHDFDIGLHARLDYRGYLSERRDFFLQTGLSAAWVGPVLTQVGYTLQLNLSTISLESYQRHLLSAKFAVRIPGDFYLTLKGQLNLLQAAPTLFVPVPTIDEENRSLVMADIERPLPRGLAILARYAGYFNVPWLGGNEPPYQRHTVYLGVSFRLERQQAPAP